MPWKWIVCGCRPPLTKRMRRRSPSVALSVGPGMRPLNDQAGNLIPGATSTSCSLADSVHYGAAVRYSTSEPLTLVGEVFADDPKGAKAQWQANVGIQYALRKSFVLDAA